MTQHSDETGTEQPTIHLMDDALASRVAAGEVVERPASVIKELVENSIDAGAHSVRVEIARGGVALIKVDDDGGGMSRVDLALCTKSHATSKITRFEDLYEQRSMGFRGEALPSIAAVSHMTISTRRARDVEGSCIISHGGEEEELRATGCSPAAPSGSSGAAVAVSIGRSRAFGSGSSVAFSMAYILRLKPICTCRI